MKTFLKNSRISQLTVASLLLSLPMIALASRESVKLADIASIEGASVQKVAEFKHPLISESSGVVLSRQWENIMWTHNDSGDSARIFATDLEGGVIFPPFVNSETYEGLAIGDAVNVDWEDIATDNHANLYIAACGNNANMRRDLAIYKIREPHPRAAILTRYHQIYRFEWPDQETFPPEKLNFDCEALFWANGRLYLLSKNRSDAFTNLYRFDVLDGSELNIPTRIGTFETRGQVTAADATPDGRKLAVLTYDNIWVFEIPGVEGFYEDNWLSKGKIRYLKTISENIQQSEAITFKDEDTLIITNEQRDIFELKLADMVEIER